MYYHGRTVHCRLCQYQHDTEVGKIRSPQLASCMSDLVPRPSTAVGSSGNFGVVNSAVEASHQAQMNDFDGLRRVWNNGYGGTAAAESRMTSYGRDVTRHGEGRPGDVLPPPGPYDCKPPYSYISLIAMAIESSPDRRFICSILCNSVPLRKNAIGPISLHLSLASFAAFLSRLPS